MDEQVDERTDFDDWPMPSRDVLRELERPVLWRQWADAEPGAAPFTVAA